jgi:hypothetical protein
LQAYCKEFGYFVGDFDCDMDYMANRANFDYYWQEFKQLEATMKKSTNFFSVSEYKYPTFQTMKSELDQIDNLGAIADNSDFSMPLVVFNTYNLQAVYNYFEKVRSFERLPLNDERALAKNEVPHYFQTVYIPDDKFLVLGGLERETSITSQRCFIVDDRGRLSTTADLNVGRQYTTICLDREFEEVYAIGGYHS